MPRVLCIMEIHILALVRRERKVGRAQRARRRGRKFSTFFQGGGDFKKFGSFPRKEDFVHFQEGGERGDFKKFGRFSGKILYIPKRGRKR